jgi:hypothetical protein
VGEIIMTGFLDHLRAEMQALERSLENDPRYIKLRELQRVRALYEGEPGAAPADSPAPIATQQRSPHRRPAPREMSPETKRVISAANELMAGRSEPMPLRDLYHEIADVQGIPIGGNKPINNLSAMLYRYGFEAVGRAGWRLRQSAKNVDATDSEPDEPDAAKLFSAPALNGSAPEIHGAATL